MNKTLFYDGDRKFQALSDPGEIARVEGLRLAVGIMRTEPEFVYFGGPVTGGENALRIAKERGFDSILDVKFKLSPEEFVAEVIRPNVLAAQTREATYRRDNPELKSITPVDLEEQYHKIAGGQLNGAMSEEGFMAFWLPTFQKLLTGFPVPEGWASSNGTTEEVMEATAIQAGLRDRTPQFALEHYDPDPAKRVPLSLNERVRELGKMVEEKLSHDVAAPAQTTALARMFAIHDMIQNNELGVIDANLLYEYDAADLEAMKQKWKPMLLDKAAHTMTLDGLGEEYARAAEKLAAKASPKPAAKPGAARGVKAGLEPAQPVS